MKIPSISLVIKAALALGAVAGLTSTLQAQDPNLLVYDSFDYSPLGDSIEFMDGGIGWAAAWNFRTSIDGKGAPITDSAIIEDGMSYDGLEVAGNSVHLYGDLGSIELGRRFANPIPGTAGTHTYISFIGQRVGPAVADPNDTSVYPDGYPWGNNLYPRGAAVRFFNESNGEVFQIGNFSNQETNVWGIFADGGRLSDVPFTEKAFVVVRIDHVGDETVADNIYMWVNPTLSLGEDIGLAQVAVIGITDLNDPQNIVDFSNLAWISPWAGNSNATRPHAELLLDEFRIGTTWNSVTPGGGSSTPTWAGYDIDGNGFVDTGDFMGWLYVTESPWVFSTDLYKYVFAPEEQITAEGGWIFVPKNP